MGQPEYSVVNRSIRASSLGYETKSANEIFEQRSCHPSMNPYDIKLRESRDSANHPKSIPIIIALDVTGSMGMIPHNFVQTGLPHMMGTLIESGVKDPQILFLAIGDIPYGDRSPFQVGQFESDDEMLDTWLTRVHIERGGGGNNGESYTMAHYFAGYHTAHDHHDKRGQKGFLFTIGDEPTHTNINPTAFKEVMNVSKVPDLSAKSLIKEAKKLYHVYHLHVKQGDNGHRQSVIDGWKGLLGERCIEVEDYREIPNIIAKIILGFKETHSDLTLDQMVKDQKESKVEEDLNQGQPDPGQGHML